MASVGNTLPTGFVIIGELHGSSRVRLNLPRLRASASPRDNYAGRLVSGETRRWRQ